MIGVDIIIIRVMTHKELKSEEIMGLSQDSNQEWVLLLTAIYAVTATVLPALIYQNELRNLKNIWIKNIGQDIIYFPATLTR